MINKLIKNKRGPWLEIILICTIVFLISLIVYFTLTSNNTKFFNVLSASKESTIEIQNTEFDGIKMITETSISNKMSYKLSYPETKFEDLNNNIIKYISDSKSLYTSKFYEKEKKKGHLNIHFNIYPYKNYYSIVLTKVVTYDFSKYDVEYHTYFIEKDSGNNISLKNILTDNVSHFTLLSNYVQNTLLKSKDLVNRIGKEIIVNSTNPIWENYNCFSIINDQLNMYFNIGETNPTGTVTPTTVKVNVPYLNPILNAAFQTEKKSKNDILSDQKKNRKRVALTFDDGPHQTVTKQILNLLDKYDAKATFFVVGTQVKKNKEVLKEVKNRGHEIGNHTLNHKKLTKLTVKQIEYEINSTNNLIKEAIGEEATVMRPPYGATNKKINQMIKVPVVLWTVDTLDWKYKDAKKLLPMVKKNIHNNGIILMHDIHQSTADGLESVLAYLKEEGYEFVTVSELLAKK